VGILSRFYLKFYSCLPKPFLGVFLFPVVSDIDNPKVSDTFGPLPYLFFPISHFRYLVALKHTNLDLVDNHFIAVLYLFHKSIIIEVNYLPVLQFHFQSRGMHQNFILLLHLTLNPLYSVPMRGAL
jgi:hypothetical protein